MRDLSELFDQEEKPGDEVLTCANCHTQVFYLTAGYAKCSGCGTLTPLDDLEGHTATQH